MARVELNKAAIQEFFADPSGGVSPIIRVKTAEVEAMAKTLMLIPGSGRRYLVGDVFFRKGGRLIHFNAGGGGGRYAALARTTDHTASAGGAPGSDDPGHAGLHGLRDSIHSDFVIGDNPRALGPTFNGQVGSSIRYVIFVERGTRYMAPRPILVPALHIVVG